VSDHRSTVRHTHGIAFASEAKGLLHFQSKIQIFPPGHVYDSRLDEFICWAPRYWDECCTYNTDVESIKQSIYYYMNNAVKMRIESAERPIGFFLSGGLDSSIIAALGKNILGNIQTFSIGLERCT
jgi:asparagine synthase (glutamine-hydrolysing)